MATGTGLPFPKSGDVRSQPAAFVDGDQFSSARNWKAIETDAAKLTQTGVSLIDLELTQQKIGYYNQVDNDAERKKIELHDKHAKEPTKFKEEWDAFQEGTLASAPSWAYNHVKRKLNALGNSALGTITAARRAEDHAITVQNHQAGLTTTENAVLGAAMAGSIASRESIAKLSEYRSKLNAGVASRLMSQDESDRRYMDIEARATGASLVKEIGDGYRAQRGQMGVDAAADALKRAEDVILRGNLPLSEDQRWAYFRKAQGEIRALEAVRKQDLSLARQARADMEAAMRAGVRPDQQSIDSVVDDLNRAGASGEGARFLASVARQERNLAFGRLPLEARNRELIATETLSQLNVSPFERRLILRESSGNPAAVNRFGFAGLYQFGAPRLASVGLYEPGAGEDLSSWNKTPRDAAGKWSGEFLIPGHPEVKTLPQFLASPAAQRAAYEFHRQKMDREISENALNTFEGKDIGGVRLSRESLYSMLHLGGVAGTKAALTSGGAVNPADANRTSLLEYARLGADTAASVGPGMDPRLFADMRKATKSEAHEQWKKIAQDLDAGTRPAPDSLQAIINAARLTGDHDLLEEIGDRFERFERRTAAGQAPLGVQEGTLTELQRTGATEGLPPGQKALLKDLREVHAETTKGLASDPVNLVVRRFPERFGTPRPLDFSSSETLRAGLRYRAQIVGFGAQNYATQALPALSPADVEAFQATLQRSDAAGRARLFADITAALPADIRAATFGKLGSKSPAAMVDAFAGAMYAQAPDVAESIVRGRQAIGADDRLDPLKGGNKAAFNQAIDKVLPAAAFSIGGRTNPGGAYQTMRAAVVARYADLSGQAADTSGTLNDDRLRRAVQDVTGGMVSHNGNRVIAPARGTTQAQFDTLLWNLKDEDLAEASTLLGAPITADYLRQSARLESLGDGRYLVVLNQNPAAPQYAVRWANTESPSPFVLDLRNRPTTPLNDELLFSLL